MVREGESATFTVTLTPSDVASTADVLVDYRLSGTATGGSDYTAPAGRLTIGQGRSNGTITIDTHHDSDPEPGETLRVTLLRASSAGDVTVDPAAAVTTITDDLTVSADDVTATEGAAALFTVTLSDPVDQAVEVSYRTTGGSGTRGAVEGTDYTGTSGTLTFDPGGSLRQTITVETTEDRLNEADETFDLALSLVTQLGGLSVGTPVVVATILDDDPLQAVVGADDAVVREGESATFTVTLRPADITSTADVVVDYQVNGTATSGSDYTAPSGTLTIRRGSASGTITIVTLPDAELDPDETLQVTLAQANSAGEVSIGPAAAVTRITDDVTVSAENVTAPEGATALFAVTLSDPVDQAVEVSYRSTGGSGTRGAVEGTDYTGTSGTLTFDPGGSLRQTITVETTEDRLNEADETFDLDLSLVTQLGGLSVGTPVVVATIRDDDELQAVVRANEQVIREGDSATFTVTLSSIPPGVTSTAPVLVEYQVTGTATSDSDYTAPAGILTIGPGTSRGTFTIATLPDTALDPGETLRVTLLRASSAGEVTVGPAAAVTRITDDVTVSARDVTAPEGAAALFVVALSDPVDQTVAVSYRTTGGSGTHGAVEGTDYTGTSGTLTFDPGGPLRQTITVETTDDRLNEADEMLAIRLATQLAGLSVGTPVVVATIIDDDALRASVRADQQVVPEGGSATFTVTLTSTPPGAVSTADVVLDYVVGGTATSGIDYTAPADSLTIAAGAASGTITIATLLDGEIEDTAETLQLVLQSARSSGAVTVVATPAIATISERDPLRAEVQALAGSVAEGESAQFRVALSGGTSAAEVIVGYLVVGTATPDVDYTKPSGTLTIDAGATSDTITIETLSDSVLEPDETLTLRLDSAKSATRGVRVVKTPVTTTIIDDGAVLVAVAGEPFSRAAWRTSRSHWTTRSLQRWR